MGEQPGRTARQEQEYGAGSTDRKVQLACACGCRVEATLVCPFHTHPIPVTSTTLTARHTWDTPTGLPYIALPTHLQESLLGDSRSDEGRVAAQKGDEGGSHPA